ncbi:hypothetical protein EDB87DRAFT_1579543 [Lactarius vividus]|nr:hypothetical protein EDB87DRAFT_1579543 [Lactarius vividus]
MTTERTAGSYTRIASSRFRVHKVEDHSQGERGVATRIPGVTVYQALVTGNKQPSGDEVAMLPSSPGHRLFTGGASKVLPEVPQAEADLFDLSRMRETGERVLVEPLSHECGLVSRRFNRNRDQRERERTGSSRLSPTPSPHLRGNFSLFDAANPIHRHGRKQKETTTTLEGHAIRRIVLTR